MGLHCCVWFWGVDSLIPGLCPSCFENLENPSPWPLRVTLERRSPACGLWPRGGREPRQPVRVGRGHLAGQRGPTDGLGRRSALGLGDRSAPGRVTGARPRSLRVQSLHPWFPRPFLSGQGISWGRNGGKSSSSHSESLTCHSVRVGGRWVSGSTVASPPAFWDCRLLEGHPPAAPAGQGRVQGRGLALSPSRHRDSANAHPPPGAQDDRCPVLGSRVCHLHSQLPDARGPSDLWPKHFLLLALGTVTCGPSGGRQIPGCGLSFRQRGVVP